MVRFHNAPRFEIFLCFLPIYNNMDKIKHIAPHYLYNMLQVQMSLARTSDIC